MKTFDFAGETNTRTIILLHGAGVTRKWWHPQVAALSDEYRVIAPDIAGHGTRAGGPFSMQGFTSTPRSRRLAKLQERIISK